MKRKEIIRRLESYRKFAPEIEALARTVNEIRSGAVMPSKVIDGMPRAGTPQDMSGYAARIDKAERNILPVAVFIKEDCRISCSTDSSPAHRAGFVHDQSDGNIRLMRNRHFAVEDF